jgi:P-type Cu2+ transporter
VALTLQVVVSVLVVSCPCALGVTLPLIDEVAVARLRRAGVFVRSDSLWARLRRVHKVIFDKTGTLTLESLVLRNPAALAVLEPDDRAALWTLVRAARHPAASCVREAMLAGGWNVEADAGAGVREEVGCGLEWRDRDGREWRLGRASWVRAGRTTSAVAGFGPADAENTDLAFARNGIVIACFATGEEVRGDAVDEVKRLRARGLDVFILSGDRAEKVATMAARLGLAPAAAIAEMTPEAKAAWVRELDEGDTLMIGDGANDSLAFDAAACRGTPAVERGWLGHRSDFFFLGRGLAGVRALFEMTARRHQAIRLVLAFAAAYNLVAVGVALAGAMNPLLAAVLMPASALASLALAMIGMRWR